MAEAPPRLGHADTGAEVPPFPLWEVAVDPQLRGRRLNILMFADDAHPANTVQDHILSFRRHSRHRVFVWNPRHARSARGSDFSQFDVLVVHYSIFVLSENFLPPEIEAEIRSFPGLKVQFIQDEYRLINDMNRKVEALGIHILFSVLRPHHVDLVYHRPALRRILKFSTLPGYAPLDLVERDVPKISERPLHVVYRTRPQPYWLGRSAQEKIEIGARFAAEAERLGLKTDIAMREQDRIYGKKWISFITSSKATLCSEGGASIFDFDGTVQRGVSNYLAKHPGADFDTVFHDVLQPFEGNVLHGQLTPRAFEVIALRTALVMYPADYRGILDPWRHYIPLERDFSNVEAVAQILKDDDHLQELVDHTYLDILVERGYTMPNFIKRFDAALDRSIRTLSQRADFAPVSGHLAANASQPLDFLETAAFARAQKRGRMRSAGAAKQWLFHLAYTTLFYLIRQLSPPSKRDVVAAWFRGRYHNWTHPRLRLSQIARRTAWRAFDGACFVAFLLIRRLCPRSKQEVIIDWFRARYRGLRARYIPTGRHR